MSDSPAAARDRARAPHGLALLALVLVAACGAPPPPDAGVDAGEPPWPPDAGADAGPRIATALSLTPAQLALDPGQEAPVTATATWDDGTRSTVSDTVTWTASPPGVASVLVRAGTANDVVVRALAAGVADVTAQRGALTSNTLRVVVGGTVDGGRDGGADGGPDGGADAGLDAGLDGGAREVRAIWVTRFSYTSAQEVRDVINRAADAGFNVVFFQIRGAGDAFYQSTLEPWSKLLTGTLGRNPGWDPLATALTTAHARGLQLHAYFNVYSGWHCSGAACTCRPAQGQVDSCALPDATDGGAPAHWLRAHPTSMAVDSSGLTRDPDYFWISPADPAYRQHVLDVARELLTAYDVDGLHLDRVRYPDTWASYDPASVAAWNALPTPKPSRDDWQRENVSSMVGALYDVVKTTRPRAVLSAAVWGIYQRLPSCGTSEGYGQYYQDSLDWLATSRIDWLVPMIYWDLGTGCTDFGRLLDGFVTGANQGRIVAGMSALDGTFQPARIRARIDYARLVGAAGTALFSSADLAAVPSRWGSFVSDGGAFALPASVPPVTWR